jgi:hypothetical protein
MCHHTQLDLVVLKAPLVSVIHSLPWTAPEAGSHLFYESVPGASWVWVSGCPARGQESNGILAF